MCKGMRKYVGVGGLSVYMVDSAVSEDPVKHWGASVSCEQLPGGREWQ